MLNYENNIQNSQSGNLLATGNTHCNSFSHQSHYRIAARLGTRLDQTTRPVFRHDIRSRRHAPFPFVVGEDLWVERDGPGGEVDPAHHRAERVQTERFQHVHPHVHVRRAAEGGPSGKGRRGDTCSLDWGGVGNQSVVSRTVWIYVKERWTFR